MNTQIDRLQCVEEYLALMTLAKLEMIKAYKKLIAKRKAILCAFILESTLRQMLEMKTTDTSEAVRYNEETDKDVFKRINDIYGN
jgi:hypothetical protein